MILGLLLAGAGACSTARPLKMAYYRKNVIIKPDESIWVKGTEVKLDQLRSGLVAQMIFEETPIMVHFHKNLTRESFDKIMNKLKSEGFKNYRCTIYSD